MRYFFTSASVAVLALAMPIAAGAAAAADLGGDCCADIEERVAELEATAARKGNRKVSLTISGMVAEEITYWDDGQESNAYITGIGATLGTNVRFTGEAQIAPGWTAGYQLYLEANDGDPEFTNQTNDDGLFASKNLSTGVTVYRSYWFLKSAQLGQVSVGLLSQASDKAAALVDGSGSLLQANWVLFDGLFFNLRPKGAAANSANFWGELGFCYHISTPIGANCNGLTTNAIRYDTPTFAGFSASASWGEDDFWDMTGRYAGEIGAFKLAAAISYSDSTDSTMGLADVLGAPADKHSSYFQAGLYLEHVPTGLFAYGAYGTEDNHGNLTGVGLGTPVGGKVIPDNDHFYVKGGWRATLTPLGKTVFYGEYAQNNDQLSPSFLDQGFTASELNRYGVGIVQHIDAAAMQIWLKYRHFEGEVSSTALGKTEFEPIDFVVFGSAISF